MAIVFPGEQYAPIKPDLENIESFDNSNIGGVEKFSTITTGVISLADVVAKSGDTMTGVLNFDNTISQGNAIIDSLNLATDNLKHNGTTYLGDGGTTNYSTWDNTGHLTMAGTAKPWDDLRIEPSVRGTGSNNPTFTQFADDTALGDTGTSRGVFLYMFTDESAANEKEVFFTIQMPHGWDGGSIYMHVHWVGTVSDTTAAPRWGLEYAWKEIGATFGATTTVYTDGSNYTGSGTDANVTLGIHYLSKFAAIAPGSTADGLSSILIGRLFRNSSDGGDTYNAASNACGLLYIDCHFQMARLGSTDEYTA
jgi:hypothetical protein